MERGIVMNIFGAGPEILIGKIVADVPVEVIGTVLCRDHHLHGAGPTIVHRVGICFDGCFFNTVGVRRIFLIQTASEQTRSTGSHKGCNHFDK